MFFLKKINSFYGQFQGVFSYDRQIFNSVYPLTRSFFGGSVFLGSAAAWVTLVSPLVAAAVHLGNRGADSDGGGGSNRRDEF